MANFLLQYIFMTFCHKFQRIPSLTAHTLNVDANTYVPSLPIFSGVSLLLKFPPDLSNLEIIPRIFKMLMNFFFSHVSPTLLIFHVDFFQKLQEKLLAVKTFLFFRLHDRIFNSSRFIMHSKDLVNLYYRLSTNLRNLIQRIKTSKMEHCSKTLNGISL